MKPTTRITTNKTSFSETYLKCRLASPLVKIDSVGGSTNSTPAFNYLKLKSI